MKKRKKPYVMLLLVFVLSGCNLPAKAEEVIGWREKFFLPIELNPSSWQVTTMAYAFFGAAIAVFSTFLYLRVMRRNNTRIAVEGIVLYVAAGVAGLFTPFAAMLMSAMGTARMPPLEEFNFIVISTTNHWTTWGVPWMDVLLNMWGFAMSFGLTYYLPLINQAVQIVYGFIYILAVFETIRRVDVRPIAFWFFGAYLWSFLSPLLNVWRGMIVYNEEYLGLGDATNGFNFLWIVGMLLIGGVCWIGPFKIFSLYRDHSNPQFFEDSSPAEELAAFGAGVVAGGVATSRHSADEVFEGGSSDSSPAASPRDPRKSSDGKRTSRGVPPRKRGASRLGAVLGSGGNAQSGATNGGTSKRNPKSPSKESSGRTGSTSRRNPAAAATSSSNGETASFSPSTRSRSARPDDDEPFVLNPDDDVPGAPIQGASREQTQSNGGEFPDAFAASSSTADNVVEDEQAASFLDPEEDDDTSEDERKMFDSDGEP